jgi:hypothetical protein
LDDAVAVGPVHEFLAGLAVGEARGEVVADFFGEPGDFSRAIRIHQFFTFYFSPVREKRPFLRNGKWAHRKISRRRLQLIGFQLVTPQAARFERRGPFLRNEHDEKIKIKKRKGLGGWGKSQNSNSKIQGSTKLQSPEGI